MTTSDNKKELNEFVGQMLQRKHRAVWKNRKAYDRARDRKDKHLYEEIEDELEQKP